MKNEGNGWTDSPLIEIDVEQLIPNGLIIDIGAGGEGIVARLAEARVVGVDISKTKIQEAQIHGAPANWLQSDGQFLSLRDNCFDAATLWFSLGYISDWNSKMQVLREISRVLKSDGVLSIIGATIIGNERSMLIKVLWRFPNGSVSQIGYKVRGSQNQTHITTRRAVQELGFRILSEDDTGHWFRILAQRNE
ncbi:MAG: class I SAM-dependent methyltransferase [Candidatus Hodarchaeota archaeon]